MSGIYIHIPFCIQRCHYCDFYSSIRTKDINVFVDSLCKEIAHRHNFITNKDIDTIYFGGGTPSLLSSEDIIRIIDTLNLYFNFTNDIEITLEANPDDLNMEYLRNIANSYINRLSIGVQSFSDVDLNQLNRRHDSKEAVEAVLRSMEVGFERISIDMIYGLPDQELGEWEESLYKAVDLSVEHISAYHLTYEKGTNFYKWLKEGKLKETKEELSLELFKSTVEILEKEGYEHYEISNFARDEKYSRHNTKYWFGKEYLGLGPSAHSYNGGIRQWNVSDLDLWFKHEDNWESVLKSEVIDIQTKRNELIMTRLRTKWGVSELEFKSLFGNDSWLELKGLSSEYVDRGLLEMINNHLILTQKGKFLADGIIADLFIL